MNTKSRKNSPRMPRLARGPYLKAMVRVPVPPEVAQWQRPGASQEPARYCSQERAQAITGKSAHTVRRWANDRQPVDVTSLQLLQVWIWGIIPSAAFIDRGVFLKYSDRFSLDAQKRPQDVIVTDNGYTITAAALESFGWLKTYYDTEVRRYQDAISQQPATPGAVVIPFAEYVARMRERVQAASDDGQA